MTDEQWDNINSRLMALEVFVAAIARQQPERPVRVTVASATEDIRSAGLYTQMTDSQLEQLGRRLQALAELAWGQGGSTHQSR